MTSKEKALIKKAKENLDNAQKEYEVFHKKPLDKVPDVLSNACPKCKVKANEQCVSSSGHIASGVHKARQDLIKKELDEHNKKTWERSSKLNQLTCNINSARKELQKLQRDAEQRARVEKFVKGVSLSKCIPRELVIEWDGYSMNVIKIRNIKGVHVGEKIEDKNAVNGLMDKGIDVIVVRRSEGTRYKHDAFPMLSSWRVT